MIDMLKGGLVPFIRVVEVLCDGNPYQDCYGCGKRVNLVNLEDVIIYKRIDLLGLSTPLCKDISAILHFGDIPILLFCAGSPCRTYLSQNFLQINSICLS